MLCAFSTGTVPSPEPRRALNPGGGIFSTEGPASEELQCEVVLLQTTPVLRHAASCGSAACQCSPLESRHWPRRAATGLEGLTRRPPKGPPRVDFPGVDVVEGFWRCASTCFHDASVALWLPPGRWERSSVVFGICSARTWAGGRSLHWMPSRLVPSTDASHERTTEMTVSSGPAHWWPARSRLFCAIWPCTSPDASLFLPPSPSGPRIETTTGSLIAGGRATCLQRGE